MLFDIDPSKHRVVDLSAETVVPGTPDRPFKATRGLLADRAFKHDIVTHTHVGVHIESPAHFFENGRELCAYPLSQFYGRAVLFEFSGVDSEALDGRAFEADVGALVQPGDILLCRNNHPDAPRLQRENPGRLPYLCPDGARWLVGRKIKLLVIDAHTGIRLSADPEMSRENHDILMGPGSEMPILEGAGGLSDLTKKRFFFMALPFRVKGVDSAWARAIAVEEP
jgi:arylformamidase